jgi:predicted flap endonuclease-1-like 5' DNA nuclease
MLWLQENWIIAVVGLVVAVVLLWWLFGRGKADDIAPPAAEPTKPAKPLEPVKPQIIAAEPARFKPIEPAPTPVPAPVTAPAPPAPAPQAAPAADPIAPAPIEPVVIEPVAPTAAPETAPEPEPAAAPTPTSSAADDLQLLKGVGPKMVGLLNGLGVTSFQQIANWTDADVAAIDPQLGAFQGRITRDNIVDQAGYLARGDKAGFEAKYGALGGAL